MNSDRRMNKKVIFLSVPGLRQQDLSTMPNLSSLSAGGSHSRIEHSFPCVTWPSQANMLTGKKPAEHGVVANGFYWREKREVEMWTAWNEVIEQPQIWDVLKKQNPDLKTAAWFPMLSKGCGADYVCMPAPIHKPDGSEDLWCYTKPQEFYGELLDSLDHFPLKHFWGPLANIKSSQWIADSAVIASRKFAPDFLYIYLPHLDYAAQKNGPDSAQAISAIGELDTLIGKLAADMTTARDAEIVWMIASEYVITPVDHVAFPNRVLREAGLLQVKMIDDREHLDLESSQAWALVDHQFSHVFVNQRDAQTIDTVEKLFSGGEGIDRVLVGDQRAEFAMNHPRSGDVILISSPNSWQAYYWWLDDALAPGFASTVDIHRKPGYDPIELHFDFATRSVPLDATLAKGSHGTPVTSKGQKGVFLCSHSIEVPGEIADVAVFDLVIGQFQ